MSGAERKKEWITFAEGLNPEMAEEGGCGVHVRPSISLGVPATSREKGE